MLERLRRTPSEHLCSFLWYSFRGAAHLMCVSSMSAKPFQLLRSELVLFPLGHHSTLPRPNIRVPSNTSWLRTWISRPLPLFSLVSSIEPGRRAFTLVTRDSLRCLAITRTASKG